MFEFEIMITGYTTIVVVTTVVVSRFVCRKKFNKLNLKLSELEQELNAAERKINALKTMADNKEKQDH